MHLVGGEVYGVGGDWFGEEALVEVLCELGAVDDRDVWVCAVYELLGALGFGFVVVGE